MKHSLDTTESHERVLNSAERLFAQRGYNSVTLRDIAADVGVHHTTLYHHVPGGKEQLFIDVLERTLQHHRKGMTDAIAQAQVSVRSQLYAVAEWLLSQPPMDLVRLTYSDMPAIDPAQAERLLNLTYDAMLSPIEKVLRSAQQRGEIVEHDYSLVAGTFLGMIENLYSVPSTVIVKTRQQMAAELITILLMGLRASTDRDEAG